MAEPLSEHVVRRAHPRLRPYVQHYTGYRLEGFASGIHAGLPSRSLTLIFAFDESLDVEMEGKQRQKYWAMLSGLHTAPALVRHGPNQHGVQLSVTPRGALTLFGVPAASFTHDVVHLEQVEPKMTAELIDRLSTARSWNARWSILDEVLLRLLHDEASMPAEVEAAWSLLVGSHGIIGIDELAQTLGWSRRHLSGAFKRSLGLSPKTMARVIRFERAQKLLRLPTRPSLSSVAHACGYADQAHMTREWREFAGSPPTTWMTDETIPILQDNQQPTVRG